MAGIGIRPNVDLAQQAGLQVENGIIVDDRLLTSAPDVFAAGDVAQVFDPITGTHIVDSLWWPARQQGYVAGLNMAGVGTKYVKTAPFNVTRLAGLTTTIIGTVGRGNDEDLVGIARGDSEIWRHLPNAIVAQTGFDVNRLRLLVGEKTLLGAIVMGDQKLSFPLEKIISGNVDITPIRDELLAPNADVLLCVANPPAFSVLPGPFSPPPPQAQLTGERPLPPQLYELYATRYPATPNLSLTVTTNATYWGDVLGAMTAFKTLNDAGVSPQMFPEMVTTMPTLRRRNVILVGAPAYSPIVARSLEKCPLHVNYLNAIVGPATEQSPAARYALERDQQQHLAVVFGLITVLPGESSGDHQDRILIFSGINSAGAQAAAEFFSSPEHLLELVPVAVGPRVLQFLAVGALEADVDDVGAVLDLPARDFGGLFPLLFGDHVLEQAGADDIGPLAHNEGTVRVFGFH